MSEQAEKKCSGGWRVKVTNVIKAVSSTRKPTKVKNDANTSQAPCDVSSLKSPKFFFPDKTSVERTSSRNNLGGLMMLEAAQAQYGLTPVQSSFRGQKVLIYTLPNTSDRQNADREIREENPMKPIDKIKPCGSELCLNGTEKNAEVESNAHIDRSGLPDGSARSDHNPSDGSEPDRTGGDGGKRPDGGASLFSHPAHREVTQPTGMYFGSQPINLQLDVK